MPAPPLESEPAITRTRGGWCSSSEEHLVATEGGVLSCVCEAKRLGIWVPNLFSTRFLGVWCRTPDRSTEGAKHPRSAKQDALKTGANSFGTSFLGVWCRTPEMSGNAA